MKEGRPERTTIWPLIEPTIMANTNVAGMAMIKGKPSVTTQAPKNRPAKATIDPS